MLAAAAALPNYTYSLAYFFTNFAIGRHASLTRNQHNIKNNINMHMHKKALWHSRRVHLCRNLIENV